MTCARRLPLGRPLAETPHEEGWPARSPSPQPSPQGRGSRRAFPAIALALSLGLVALVPSLPAARAPLPVAAAFNTNKLAEMDQAVAAAIGEKRLPGAVLWLERTNVAYHKAYGQRAVRPDEEPMTEQTVFDLASLTKVVATAPSIMILMERGQVKLDAPVRDYVPEFGRKGKDRITVRHLLTHTSGLRAGLGRRVDGVNSAIAYACDETTNSVPGTSFLYSDINFIMLGEIVRRVTHAPLDSFATREIFAPLQMRDTGFLPGRKTWGNIAPTEVGLRGTVHDPTARGMGGVAGHAGVFSTARDLARFARMMLNGGELDGARVLKPETVRLMTAVQTPPDLPSRRGFGWDIDTGYSRHGKVFPLGSYGHTGFTGTSIWIDPFSQTFLILLSNRVHPDGRGDIRSLQNQLATLAAEAVLGFDFTNVAGALPPRTTNAAPAALAQTNGVLNGIDVLKKQGYTSLRGLKVGLITNHTGRDREGNATIDLLRHAPGVTLKVLFSPEHGIRGQLDEAVGDTVDGQTGLPVYSLYGDRRSPIPEQLAGLDALVFDIQDIGCRFYTYISTLGLCLEASAKAKIKFVVLDRVNPINGLAVEGPVFHGQPRFVAFHPLPLRHGMTVGELARMYNEERGWKANLEVVPMEGWKRGLWFDQTGVPWVNPSPNMRNMAAATVYPGVGLVEFAISVGRGTDTPFGLAGAPYVDADKLATAMNAAGLPGIRFEPVRFKPVASVFKDKDCGGVSFVLEDRERCQPVDVGITLALTLQRLYPEDFDLEKVNVLLLDLVVLDAIRSGHTLAEIKEIWAGDLKAFKKRREEFLLYQ
jgi:uncharacterized protein YbbC (DUF1343 family)/CubicO group peptidase (beta-lactamase class C family)